jgi:hypothetical protein
MLIAWFTCKWRAVVALLHCLSEQHRLPANTSWAEHLSS